MTFYVNILATVHKSGFGCAVSKSLMHTNGITPKIFHKFVEDNGLGEFGNDYTVSKFNKKKQGLCKQFFPSEKGLSIGFDVNRKLNGRKSVQRVKNSRYELKVLSEHDIAVHNVVKFNVEAAQRLTTFESTDKRYQETIRFWGNLLVTHFPCGNFPHAYYRNRTGRLTAVGYSLQCAPKYVRESLFPGHWSYDFVASQPSLISQITDVKTPTLEHYVNNRTQVRKEVGKHVCISESSAKTVIHAIAFSASMSGDKNTCLVKKLGKVKFDKLNSNSFVTSFYKELKETAIELATGKYSNWYSGIRNLGKRQAYIAQHIESKMLDAVMSEHDLVLLLHDGFISEKRLDTQSLQQLIFDCTGIHIQIQENKL